MNHNKNDEQEVDEDEMHHPSHVTNHLERLVSLLLPRLQGSNSDSSSSARQNRIVELLHPDDHARDTEQNVSREWVIGDEFYNEDVADNSNNVSEDDEDETDEEILDHHGAGEEAIDAYEDPQDFDFVEIEGADDEDVSTTDTDDDEDDDGIENYDTQLPASHPYLGDNLKESRGRLVLVENSITSLLLINFRHIVLFPGQTLPITTTNLSPQVHHCLLECVQTGPRTIGLMSDPSVNLVGTTAEIRNYSIEQGGELKLILEGRQRFKLIDEPFEIAKKAEIMILPEVTLGPPYPSISSLVRFYSITDTPSRFIVSKHPHWLLNIYEAKNVMKRILEEIKDWCSADVSKDPNEFSYWVAANLPISNSARMQALIFTCAEARLLWLLDVLKKSAHFACSTCHGVICLKSDVFSMSRSGPQSSFVNSGGFIHDTITVRKAAGLIQAYNWSSQFTWFPGYKWRLASCARCNRHIGWCYKSMQAETKPRRFFGISRVNVSLQ